MKVQYSWLKEFVKIDISAQELAKRLTESGLEVENVIYLGQNMQGVYSGKITKIEQHPNADKLIVCQVDMGNKMLQIVTGAKNVAVGDIVPVATEGASLIEGFRIKKSNLRGVDSFGMFCSGHELGIDKFIHKNAEVDGIMILDKNTPLNAKVSELLDCEDYVLDISVTSNRPDCQSIIGIAREVSAILNSSLSIDFSLPGADIKLTEKDKISVSVLEKELCGRYLTRTVNNIVICPSPRIIQLRLINADIRPINNIVDITNYILVECGQPMHAFDKSKLKGNQIVVNKAVNGEKFTALNEQTYALNNSMLTINDAERTIALAGVIGGQDSCIDENTKNIVLESATFDRANIRRTSRGMGIRTDSSGRFERGLDLGSPEIGLNRALQLIKKYGWGKITDNSIDCQQKPILKRTITASYNHICSLLGIKIDINTMLEILNHLDLQATIIGDNITCVVPLYREDIENYADLAEDIIRLYGYEHITDSMAVTTDYTQGKKNAIQVQTDKIKNLLLARGYREIINFSMISETAVDKLLITKNDILRQTIKIGNPISEDLSVMRTVMAHNMLDVVSHNLKHGTKKIKLFESGRVYLPKNLPLTESPQEINKLSIVHSGTEEDFYTIKGLVELILEPYSFSSKLIRSNVSYLHNGISAEIINLKTGISIAHFGEIQPLVQQNY
ncbi:MAG: phenylalanine--tRNA ligase subunit beta, partial [Clostridia bacterium]|nr:phenylalanine--tRNA ligase subunit beta [Clostridia bacterium]